MDKTHLRSHRSRVALPFVGLGALTLAGCGSGDSDEAAPVGGLTVPPTEQATLTTDASGATVVDVEAGEYFFKSPLTTFEVGVPYHFVVHNTGDEEHEFMLVEPIAAGEMSMEMMDDMAVGHIEGDDLQPAQTTTLDVTFTEPYPAGMLELACHIDDHYEEGMILPIVVTP